MTPAQARFLHASTLVVGGTGLVYAWMLYFARPADELALVNHPWQPHVQHAHVVTAPLLVFACGLVWQRHVWARWRSGFRARRRTGLALATSFGPMAISGYLVQVSVEEAWRRAWVVVHVATSIAWIALYLVHQLSPRGARDREPDPDAAA